MNEKFTTNHSLYLSLISTLRKDYKTAKEDIKYLLKTGHSLNILNQEQDNTPLLYAINQNFQNFSLLLQFGASLKQPHKHLQTPLMMVCERFPKAIKKILFYPQNIDHECKNKGTALTKAIISHPSLMKILVDHGANVNHLVNGNTPLTLLLKHNSNYLAGVNLLLENKADVNIASSQGDTPIMLAVMSGKAEVVKTILAYNPDLTYENKEGKNVFNVLDLVKRINKKPDISLIETYLDKYLLKKENLLNASFKKNLL